jgi:hypothetical protein
VALPLVAVIGDTGYTSEYQPFGTPEPVVQLAAPELLDEEELEGAVVGKGISVGIGA